MLKTILIDNRDLAFTVDTYATFTLDDETESTLDWLNEESKTELTYDDFDWTYDNKGYIEHLAENSVYILQEALIDDVVKKIELVKTASPQFYNYTTDSYTANWTVDTEKLEEFIKNHQGEYNSFERENWYSVYDSHGTEDFKQEDYIVASLDYYTRIKFGSQNYVEEIKIDQFEDEAYISDMFEQREASEYIDFKKIEQETK